MLQPSLFNETVLRKIVNVTSMPQRSLFNTKGVQALAQEYGFDAHIIPMKNTHNAKTTELLIGRDLDWARPF